MGILTDYYFDSLFTDAAVDASISSPPGCGNLSCGWCYPSAKPSKPSKPLAPKTSKPLAPKIRVGGRKVKREDATPSVWTLQKAEDQKYDGLAICFYPDASSDEGIEVSLPLELLEQFIAGAGAQVGQKGLGLRLRHYGEHIDMGLES